MSTDQDDDRNRYIFERITRLSAQQLKFTGDLMRLFEKGKEASSDQASKDRLAALWRVWREKLDEQIKGHGRSPDPGPDGSTDQPS